MAISRDTEEVCRRFLTSTRFALGGGGCGKDSSIAEFVIAGALDAPRSSWDEEALERRRETRASDTRSAGLLDVRNHKCGSVADARTRTAPCGRFLGILLLFLFGFLSESSASSVSSTTRFHTLFPW